jgi:Sec-independent protein secretion pathway component TatC
MIGLYGLSILIALVVGKNKERQKGTAEENLAG